MIKNLLKNKSVIFILAAILIAAIGFSAGMLARTSMAKEDASNCISASRAKQIALESVGVTPGKATFTQVEMDRDNSSPYYEIDFFTSATEYEFEVDAVSGTILHKESRDLIDPEDRLAVPDEGNSPSINNDQNNPPAGQPGVNNAHHRERHNGSGSHDYIGVSQAKQIAADHIGAPCHAVNFTSAHLDSDNGTQMYEIEFIHNNIEYEFDIHATTGSILSFESDSIDSDD